MSCQRCAPLLIALVVVAQPVAAAPRPAAPSPATSISSDPFPATAPGQHASEVEPAGVGYGGTFVAAFQVGRFVGAGAAALGWATWRAGTWQHGLLPGLTRWQHPAGPYSLASDPSVAYDARRHLWLVAALAVVDDARGRAIRSSVLLSRSRDGLRWGRFGPAYTLIADTGSSFYDKDWIACDNWPSSPFYGRCYATWDIAGRLDYLLLSTSRDGGQTWSTPVAPDGAPTGLSGQPVVAPDGTVVVPALGDFFGGAAIFAVRSTDGGVIWSGVTVISRVRAHRVAGRLRVAPLPSVAVDGGGRVYVAWQDCRFEPRCAADDIVLSSSADGLSWSRVRRVPTGPVGSGLDRFIPGLAAGGATAGRHAHLGLVYYYYPHAACTAKTCRLDVGFISSVDGGAVWSAPRRLAGPMRLSWLAATSSGRMVGDYISASFVRGRAIAVFAVARAPTSARLHEAMDAAILPITG